MNGADDWTPSPELGQLLALRRASRGLLYHRGDELFGGSRPTPTWLLPHVVTLLEAKQLHRVPRAYLPGTPERIEPTVAGYRLLRDLEARRRVATTSAVLDVRVDDRVLLLGDDDPLHERLRAAINRADLTTMPANAPLSQVTAGAPFDRIIVSEPTRAVAWAWVQRIRPGGLLLCVLNPSGLASRCVALRCYPDRARGRFLDDDQGMVVPQIDPDRTPSDASPAEHDTRRARTNLPLRLSELGVPWYLATATLPDVVVRSAIDDWGLRLAAGKGFWCEITDGHPDGRRHGAEDGPPGLFGHVARIHRQWHELGKPGWDRLTLTVTPDQHVIRVDDGAGDWQLPE